MRQNQKKNQDQKEPSSRKRIMKEADKKLAELLIREEIITREQLEDALREKNAASHFLGELLLHLKYVSEEELIGCLVRSCRIPHLKLSNLQVRPETAGLLQANMCSELKLLPIDKLGTLLTVAMVNPLDSDALETVKKEVKLRIKPILCSWGDFTELYSRIYNVDDQKIRQMYEEVDEEGQEEDKNKKQGDVTSQPQGASANSQAAMITPEQAGVPEPAPLNGRGLIVRFTFENFVVAEANSFTYALAKSVAEAPGAEYNPLFIYGNTGLGKTHLSNAIGNESVQNNPALVVMYIPTSQFVDEMLNAIEHENMKEFRTNFDEIDILIVDDIQFLSGRTQAQEEFFNIFNAIYNRKRQIILISDVPPKGLQGLESRLISRFEGGVVACMEEPDYQTRLTILRQKSASAGAAVPEEVLQLLATSIPSNVRELEGALKKLLAYSSLVGHEITEALAREILKHLFRPAQA